MDGCRYHPASHPQVPYLLIGPPNVLLPELLLPREQCVPLNSTRQALKINQQLKPTQATRCDQVSQDWLVQLTNVSCVIEVP